MLLGSSLSYNYDMTQALRRVRRHVYVYHSPRDAILNTVQLVGTVDAVFREDLGGHRLVDWKTGELGEPEDQLLFYALLWALDRDDIPAYVEAVSVRTGERYQTVPSSGDLMVVASEVAAMVAVLRESWHRGDRFDRHGGPWCSYCPLLLDCAEGQSAEALLG